MGMNLFQSFKLNERGNDYVVGDIHGCYSLLEAKLNEIKFDQTVDRLFCVGDMVDRGDQSHCVIEWLSKDWLFSVMGNHEDMAIEYFEYISHCMVNHVPLQQRDMEYIKNYEYNGGSWFMISPLEIKKEIYECFKQLPLAIEIETKEGLIGITHASTQFDDWKILKETLIREQNSQNSNEGMVERIKSGLLWDRSLTVAWCNHLIIKNVHKVYHGHTPTQCPILLGNRAYIDTGAFYSGQLSIVKL